MKPIRPVNLVAASAAIDSFLSALGFDASHPQLVGTGARVAALYTDGLLSGSCHNPANILSGVMPCTADVLIEARHLDVTIVCPHHLTLGQGQGLVAFRPRHQLVGFGALAALLDAHTKTFALQEEACSLVVKDLMEHLDAQGAICVLDLQHGCMAQHGPKQGNARIRTISTAGTFDFGGRDHAIGLGLAHSQ